MLVSCRDQGTQDLYDRRDTRHARKVCPASLWRVARRKLDQLNAAVSLESLGIPPGNRFESLKGERKGQYSIRINQQYRVCFAWTPQGPTDVEVVDYH